MEKRGRRGAGSGLDDKESRAAGRKKAVRELLEGAGMAALGALMWVLGGDFTSLWRV